MDYDGLSGNWIVFYHLHFNERETKCLQSFESGMLTCGIAEDQHGLMELPEFCMLDFFCAVFYFLISACHFLDHKAFSDVAFAVLVPAFLLVYACL